MGSNDFVLKRVKKIAETVEVISKLNDAQLQLILLRSCVGLPKFTVALLNQAPLVVLTGSLPSIIGYQCFKSIRFGGILLGFIG